MLRGSHEDRRVNKIYGLAEECALRLGEDVADSNSVFQRINRVFDMLPLAALIEEKIICVHAGFGKKTVNIE